MRFRAAKEKFDAVQVLRALAASLVVFEHALINWSQKAVSPGAMPWFPGMGDYGVKLFFGISGFIIFYTTTGESSGAQSAQAFLRRRIRRIVPLYWVLTTVYLFKLLLTGQHVPVPDALQSYLFIPYADANGQVRPVLGQGWSLDYEMLFYVTFALLFVLPRRWHASAIVLLMAVLAGIRSLGLLGDDAHPNALYHWAHPIILYFAAGVVGSKLAATWRERQWPALSQGWAATMACLIVLVHAFIVLPRAGASGEWLTPIASLLPLLLCITAQPTALARPCWPIVVAGDASYSTYLTHGFFIGVLARELGRLAPSGSMGYFTFASLCVVACTIAGYLTWRWLERPLYTGKAPWAKRKDARRRTAPIEAVVPDAVPSAPPGGH